MFHEISVTSCFPSSSLPNPKTYSRHTNTSFHEGLESVQLPFHSGRTKALSQSAQLCAVFLLAKKQLRDFPGRKHDQFKRRKNHGISTPDTLPLYGTTDGNCFHCHEKATHFRVMWHQKFREKTIGD